MLGEYLRKHREDAGLTLKEISSITRIRCEYLKALEAEEYEKIPGEVYVRGYIKAFLQTLSIDPSEAIRLYAEQKEAALAAQTPPPAQAPRSFWTVIPTHVLYPALLLLLIVPLLFFVSRRTDTVPPVIEAEQKGDSKIDRVVTILQNPVAPAEADYTNKHVLEIEAVEDTWIYLRIDDSLTYSLILEPGQKRIWTGDRGFYLKIGNAGGIRLTYDGRDLGSPGRRGEVVKLRLPLDIPPAAGGTGN